MKNGLIIATMALAGVVIPVAHATTASTFSWVTAGNSNSDLGLSYSLSNNGITLTAYGLTAPTNLLKPATAGPDLYAKNGGVGETGLGMAKDPGDDHEISAALNDGIQIDFSDALTKAPKATVTMNISSSQVGEGWAIYGSNTLYTVETASKSLGFLGEPLMSGSANYPSASVNVNLADWGQYTYYTLMAVNADGCSPQANVVLGTVTITPGLTTTSQTPEPGGMMMGGTAFIAVGLLIRKKAGRKR